MTKPRVSVIIPAYNAAATIGDQLAALERQTSIADDHEVIVCDNGSTDATAARVREWMLRDSRIRLVDASARRGPAAARNLGATHARGEYLLFCDADDVVSASWLTTLRTSLADADVVGGALEGRSLNRDNRYSVSWEVSGDLRLTLWARFRAGGSGNLAVRRAVFDAVGGFDERLLTCEDVDLCWRAQLQGFRFAHAPSAIVHCRQRDGLPAVFRQARAYAHGTRLLAHKYASIIEADRNAADGLSGEEPSEQDADGVVQGRSRNPLVRFSRLFTRTGRANLAWRLGEAVGRRSRIGSVSIDPLPAKLLDAYLTGSAR